MHGDVWLGTPTIANLSHKVDWGYQHFSYISRHSIKIVFCSLTAAVDTVGDSHRSDVIVFAHVHRPPRMVVHVGMGTTVNQTGTLGMT